METKNSSECHMHDRSSSMYGGGSQPGCRGTQGCPEIVSEVRTVMAFV